MEFCILTENEFDEFSNNHQYNSFHQISKWGKLKQLNGWTYYMVGVKLNDKIVAATLLLEKKMFLNYKMFYSPRGYLIDYGDGNLLEYFTKEIKKFCLKKKGIFVKIDPYVINKQRDIDGNIVEGGIDNSDYITSLKTLGYKHLGFTLGMEDLQPRWAFTLDLKDKTSDELLSNMESKTRQLIRKNIKNGIYTEEVLVSNVETFKKIMEHTSKRRGFIDRPFSYYKNMLEVMGDNCKILIAKINIKNYIVMLNSEISDNEKIIEVKNKDIISGKNINIDKTNKKIEEANKVIERLKKKVEEATKILEIEGEVIIGGGIIFMISSREILSLFGGAYKEYMDFISPYTTNWNMINYAVEKGYSKYSFYGITGDFSDKKSELYGLYDFKRGFGGVVEEYMGEFDLVLKPLIYRMYKISFTIYNKLKNIRGK